jgi:glycosyltransferase involved in cell wall biosynthesis
MSGEGRQGFVTDAFDADKLPFYRIDFGAKLALPGAFLDQAGVPYDAPTRKSPSAYHATTIGQFALAHWNAFLRSREEAHREAFMTQARWLVGNEKRVKTDTAVWPIPYAWPDWHAPGPWLSGLTQGIAISVLVRAHRLTNEPVFLEVASRAARVFEHDILDGGVCSPLRGGAVFFEEVAVYPAGHILNGHLYGMLGLYDYLALSGDPRAEILIQPGIDGLKMLFDAFDTGYWSRYDLLHRHLAPPFYHALHVAQFRALAELGDSPRWASVAARWDAYQSRVPNLVRQFTARQVARGGRVLHRRMKSWLRRPGNSQETKGAERVLVPVTAFPITGGIRAVLEGVARLMAPAWHIEYLARHVGPHSGDLTIRRFGSRLASPWHFPSVWLYVLSGAGTLLGLLRQRRPCRLILSQDSVFTGAFSAVAGRMAGARVVCIEHGTVTFPYSAVYRKERLEALAGSSRALQLLARPQLAAYLLSLRLMARLVARIADHFLVAGDESEQVYVRKLGVHPYRITRWRFTIDADRYAPPDPAKRLQWRAEEGLSQDAIVVALIARLSPAKGLDVALPGIKGALSQLPAAVDGRVRIIIAGEGPLRRQVEANLHQYGLEKHCRLRGEVSEAEVIRLLGISDIFLYTSTRGTNYSMAVLEAMAAGCAVIASTEPVSNAELLSGGRGLAIPSGDPAAATEALVRTICDLPLCRRMGASARQYVIDHHDGTSLRRSLLRATYWSMDLSDPISVASGNSPAG